jgi:hypothetical protein
MTSKQAKEYITYKVFSTVYVENLLPHIYYKVNSEVYRKVNNIVRILRDAFDNIKYEIKKSLK